MNNLLLIILFSLSQNLISTNETEARFKFKLYVFEGSDWCASCRRFEKEILKDAIVVKELQQYNIELIKVDFPQRKKLSKEELNSNKQLAEKYNFDGTFPTIIFVSADTNKFINLHSTKLNALQFCDWIKTNTEKLK